MEINTGQKFSVTVLLATTMEAVVEVFATNEHEAELQALEIAHDGDLQWEFADQDFIDGRVPDECSGEYYRIANTQLCDPEIAVIRTETGLDQTKESIIKSDFDKQRTSP